MLTVNLDRSELPLRTAFPILASNALSWLAGQSDDLREALAAGATAEVELPAGRTSSAGLLVWAPDGRERKLAAGGSKATIGPLDQCGVWRIGPVGEPPLLEIACNLADARASDLRPPEGLDDDTSLAGGGFVNRPVWFYLLAAAWLLAGLEWYLYQRRWIS